MKKFKVLIAIVLCLSFVLSFTLFSGCSDGYEQTEKVTSLTMMFDRGLTESLNEAAGNDTSQLPEILGAEFKTSNETWMFISFADNSYIDCFFSISWIYESEHPISGIEATAITAKTPGGYAEYSPAYVSLLSDFYYYDGRIDVKIETYKQKVTHISSLWLSFVTLDYNQKQTPDADDVFQNIIHNYSYYWGYSCNYDPNKEAVGAFNYHLSYDLLTTLNCRFVIMENLLYTTTKYMLVLAPDEDTAAYVCGKYLSKNQLQASYAARYGNYVLLATVASYTSPEFRPFYEAINSVDPVYEEYTNIVSAYVGSGYIKSPEESDFGSRDLYQLTFAGMYLSMYDCEYTCVGKNLTDKDSIELYYIVIARSESIAIDISNEYSTTTQLQKGRHVILCVTAPSPNFEPFNAIV